MSDNAISMEMQTALLGAKKTPKIGNNVSREQARRVAQEFEAHALSQFLQPMFSDIDAEEPFGGGSSEKMWRSLQVDEYGKAIARSGGIGIADSVYREIIRMQEAN